MPTEPPFPHNFKPHIVYLILDKQTEQALELLARQFSVEVPKLKVGLPKGHTRNAYGTYNAQTQTISVLDSEIFANPFVILHEFYHHLRCKSVTMQHKGTEKNADKFALEFIQQYQLAVAKAAANAALKASQSNQL
jgi:hypothetical protein